METTGIYPGERTGASEPPSSRPGAVEAGSIVRAESFGVVYREHYGAIAGLIYRRTGNAHVTEDLTSDVFVAAFVSLRGYKGEVPIIVWLRRIAQNRVNRWARREAGFRGILRRIPVVRGWVPASDQAGERSDALEAMLRLPVRQQEVLSTCYLEGLSLDEAALMLGISVEAVKSRLARARESLRRELTKGDVQENTRTNEVVS